MRDFFFQAEDGIRYLVRSRGLGDVYKRQGYNKYFKIKSGHLFKEESMSGAFCSK